MLDKIKDRIKFLEHRDELKIKYLKDMVENDEIYIASLENQIMELLQETEK